MVCTFFCVKPIPKITFFRFFLLCLYPVSYTHLDVYKRQILDYGPVIDHPPCTPAGRPILLTIEDACPAAQLAQGGMDCGACRHFRPVSGTLLGVCRNEKRPAPGAQPNLKPEEERP